MVVFVMMLLYFKIKKIYMDSENKVKPQDKINIKVAFIGS
jgi:hypothetical protein